MAAVQLTIRKALGAVKDQTSIQLAKVGATGTGSQDLDVALVKATSHEEVPSDEKYVLEILHYISYSRGYVNACIAGLSKRLSKTRNWIVAIKCLMLIHRILRDGDPLFEQELLHSGRPGFRILNLSGFRDDSQQSAWDYSAFVRTFSLFLDERLECLSVSDAVRQNDRALVLYDDKRPYRDRYDDRRSPRYDDRRSPRQGHRRSNSADEHRRSSSAGEYDYDRREESSTNGSKNGAKEPVQIKDMDTEMLLEKLPKMQRMLERVLGCRPTGAARINRLIQIALYAVISESFQLHTDLCAGLTHLIDSFFGMERHNALKAFDIYKRAAKQLHDLSQFYGLCKDIGVGRTSEYPSVMKVSLDQLDEMEDVLKNKPSSKSKAPEPPPRPRSPEPEPEAIDQAYYDTNAIRALPAPPLRDEPEVDQHEQNGDLLDMGGKLTTEEHENRLALALFSSGTDPAATGSWETFGSADQRNGVSSFKDALNEISGKAGWELALVESASNISKSTGGTLAGGFNPLLLSSMYEQAEAQQKHNVMPFGSESSVAVLGPAKPASNVLALPAPVPVAQVGEDPFSASAVIPPPSYVQLSDMSKKQQLLLQEQQMWQQYQQDGMHGYYSMMKYYNDTNMYFQPQTTFALPQYGYGVAQRQFTYY